MFPCTQITSCMLSGRIMPPVVIQHLEREIVDPVEIHDVVLVHEGDGDGDDDVLQRQKESSSK